MCVYTPNLNIHLHLVLCTAETGLGKQMNATWNKIKIHLISEGIVVVPRASGTIMTEDDGFLKAEDRDEF